MAQSQFVSKNQLFNELKQLVTRQETGLLSILTDTRRAVLLKFSEGKIVHSHCRTKDIGDAVLVLNECELVKFTFVRASVRQEPELIPARVFLNLIDFDRSVNIAGTSSTQAVSAAPLPATTMAEANGSGDAALRNGLIEIASDYVGPVADVVVDEALQNTSDVLAAIENIVKVIPDSHQAAAFRALAQTHVLVVTE